MGQGDSHPPQQAGYPQQPQARIPAPGPRPGDRTAARSSNSIPGGRLDFDRAKRDEDRDRQRPVRGPEDFAPLHTHYNSTEDKAQELCSILKSLEGQLEDPNDFVLIGKTYRGLAEWTWEHSQDSDFADVLAQLAPESMYPAWRRQALEEAYMLFFEDCAKQGNPKALDNLPEPPTSREIGYRPLPEALLDPKTTRGAAFSNTYEVGNACCIRRSWDYDVIRNGPKPRPGEKRATGRKIVAKENTERYCTCATDPVSRLISVLSPEWICCGRDRKALEAAAVPPAAGAGKRPDQPKWPPPGASKSKAANAPSASAKLKPTPFHSSAARRDSETVGSSSKPPAHWPKPPEDVEPVAVKEEPVPQLASGRKARANQQLFSSEDGQKEVHL